MKTALFFFLLCLPLSAQANSPIANVLCASTAELERRLVEQFGASRVSHGLRSPEEIMEVWTDDDGDWTLVMAYATGKSCIVAMGEHWSETLPKEPA